MRLRRRRVLVLMAGCAVIIAAVAVAVTVLLPADSKAVGDSYVVEESQMMQELRDAGIDVTSVRIVDEQVTVSYVMPAKTEENALENALKVQKIMRVAAEAGMTFLEVEGTMGDEPIGGGVTLQLLPTPVVPANEAAQGISAWINQVETTTGSQVTNQTKAGARLDLTVVGSIEELQAAADLFLNGGFGQHDKGYLEGMSLTCKTLEGETVFMAAADYVIGDVTLAYVNPSFQWF